MSLFETNSSVDGLGFNLCFYNFAFVMINLVKWLPKQCWLVRLSSPFLFLFLAAATDITSLVSMGNSVEQAAIKDN